MRTLPHIDAKTPTDKPPTDPAPRKPRRACGLLWAMAWPFRVCFSDSLAALSPIMGGAALCWLIELASFIILLWAGHQGWACGLGERLFACGFFGGLAVLALFGPLAIVGACWRDRPWQLFFALILFAVGFAAHLTLTLVYTFYASGTH